MSFAVEPLSSQTPVRAASSEVVMKYIVLHMAGGFCGFLKNFCFVLFFLKLIMVVNTNGNK